ncbi:MAG TPA: tRNA-dihydrouridine synthase family protein [Prolixibacteraceae bacterium]|jgi:tRNA-dihydrouridine synthase
MTQKIEIIYQAPLQGFTDFTYRNVFHEVYGGVTKYFIPYLSYGKGKEIKKSQLKEIMPLNNKALPAIPQVLFSDSTELFELVSILIDNGYSEINLNLGCPYPMATNRGRGAAWLEKPAALKETLGELFGKGWQAKFSVKMRAGMTDSQDALEVFEVLNQFPLEEIIYHPRTAKQMYTGKADPSLFAQALPLVKHSLVYNGDLFSVSDLQELKALLPDQHSWMTGRGLLMDPSLALQLNGQEMDEKMRKQKKKEFHDLLFEQYAERLQGGGHLLARMNQFWTYFCESFENPHKAMKLVKKSSNVLKYNAAVVEIFRDL